MNHILINDFSDLSVVLEEPIYIAGEDSLLNKEIYENMWALQFNDNLIEYLTIKELKKFFNQLLIKRSDQLYHLNESLSAILYVWFDAQALQLRFNLISATHQTLPFGCNLTIVESLDSILNDYITTVRHVKHEGYGLTYYDSLEEMENDPDFSDDQEEYTLEVYVYVIPE